MSTVNRILEKLDNYHEEYGDSESGESYEKWLECRSSIVENIIESVDTPLKDSEVEREVTRGLMERLFITERADWKAEIKKFLTGIQAETEFTASLFIPGVVHIPEGLEIGSLEIIGKPENDEILKYAKNMEKKGKIKLDNGTWGRTKFSSYRFLEGVREELYKKMELPFSILHLVIYGSVPRAPEVTGGIFSPDVGRTFLLNPETGAYTLKFSSFSEELHGDLLRKLSAVTNKDVKSKLEERILRAIEIFGLSRGHLRNELAILSIVAGFEALLLEGREPKSRGIAEKTAFLIGEERNRQEIYRYMKSLYSKRSNIVHGDDPVSVEDNDIRHAKDIFRALVEKLLELSEEYNKMQRKTHDKDEEGVEDYINELKFSTSD